VSIGEHEIIRREIVNTPQVCADGVFTQEQLDEIKNCSHIEPRKGRYDDDSKLSWNKARIILQGRHLVYQFLEMMLGGKIECAKLDLDVMFVSYAGVWRADAAITVSSTPTGTMQIHAPPAELVASPDAMLSRGHITMAVMSLVSNTLIHTMDKAFKIAFNETIQPPPKHMDFTFHIKPRTVLRRKTIL